MTTTDIQVYWYAIKVFFNKVLEIERLLNDEGIESYIPCIQPGTACGGESSARKPVVPSLVFFHSTPSVAKELQHTLYGKAMVYSRKDSITWTPAAIPEKEMNVFKLVVSAGDDGLEYFDDDKRTFRKGEHVRVTGGRFKGAEGYIRRIKGNHRLIVSLPGICAIATSYIPQCFLEKLD